MLLLISPIQILDHRQVGDLESEVQVEFCKLRTSVPLNMLAFWRVGVGRAVRRNEDDWVAATAAGLAATGKRPVKCELPWGISRAKGARRKSV